MTKTNSLVNKDVDDLDFETKIDDQIFTLSRNKADVIQKIVHNIKENCANLEILLSSLNGKDESKSFLSQLPKNFATPLHVTDNTNTKIIEGIFDGEGMVGSDGKSYSVPANYASKSKLVEGDVLKLTISENGTFLYKQISPIERKRVVGEIEIVNGSYFVKNETDRWRVLPASVTYFKGLPGDEAIILVPKMNNSSWATIENIVKKPIF